MTPLPSLPFNILATYLVLLPLSPGRHKPFFFFYTIRNVRDARVGTLLRGRASAFFEKRKKACFGFLQLFGDIYLADRAFFLLCNMGYKTDDSGFVATLDGKPSGPKGVWG